MIKYIINANRWYDTLKDPNRTLFFILYGDIGYAYWGIWMFILVLFRMIPVFVDIKNKNIN